MQILITGCAGFIGSHLTEKLLTDGHTITGIDNLYTGSKENMAAFMENPLFTFIEHDVREPFLYTAPIDHIYHLACPAAPVHYQKDPILTLDTTYSGTKHMLMLATEKKARILLASTSEVYGDPLEHPQKETYNGNVNPIGARSCYDEGKRVAESLAFAYHATRKTDIRVVRIFNTYGPRMAQNDGRVIPNFITQALHNEPVTVYGDGAQTRSFCFVSDMVQGFIAMMAQDTTVGPVNIGNPTEVSMQSVAEHIIMRTESQSPIIRKPLPADDPTRRKPDITRAKELLHWEPTIPFNDGIQKTIEYFKTLNS